MNKKFLTYGGVFIILISLVAALTVLSLDRVQIESNSAQVSGEQWVLDVVLDQLNDKITGIVEKESISTDGKMAENDLYLDAEVIEKACTYNMVSQNKLIFSSYQTQMGGWPFNDESECYNQGGAYYIKESGEINGRCVFLDPEAFHATLDFDRYQFDARLTLKVDGETEIGHINNMDSPDVSLGSRAHADWVGNLVSGDLCEDPRDQGVVAILSSSGNRITSETKYDDYNIFDGAGFENCLDQAISLGGLTTQDCVDQYNSLSLAARQSKTFKSSDGSTATVSGSTAKIDLKNAIQFPMLRLRIKADWLGIFIPVGEPEIISLDTDDFVEGDGGSLKVNYRNKGQYEGSFSLSAVCQDNIEVLGTVPTLTLGPGESGSRTFSLESKKDVSSPESDTCTITFEERNSKEKAIKSIKVTVNQQTFCTAPDEKCIGEQAYMCSGTGQWERDESNDDRCVVACQVDSDCDDGNPDTIDTCEGAGITGKVCKHVLDPNVAKAECDAKGGKFIKYETEPPFWQFWRDPSTTYICLTPHASPLGIAMLVMGGIAVGGTIIFLGGMPIALGLSVAIAAIGTLITLFAGIGVI